MITPLTVVSFNSFICSFNKGLWVVHEFVTMDTLGSHTPSFIQWQESWENNNKELCMNKWISIFIGINDRTHSD